MTYGSDILRKHLRCLQRDLHFTSTWGSNIKLGWWKPTTAIKNEESNFVAYFNTSAGVPNLEKVNDDIALRLGKATLREIKAFIAILAIYCVGSSRKTGSGVIIISICNFPQQSTALGWKKLVIFRKYCVDCCLLFSVEEQNRQKKLLNFCPFELNLIFSENVAYCTKSCTSHIEASIIGSYLPVQVLFHRKGSICYWKSALYQNALHYGRKG